QTFRALVSAARSGRIPEQRLESAVKRMLEAKARRVSALLPVDVDEVDGVVGSVEHRQRALALARKTITVVRDAPSALPLPRDLGGRLVILSPVRSSRTLMEQWTSDASLLGSAIASLAPGAVEVPVEYPLSEARRVDVERAIDSARVIVFGTLNAVLDPDQIRL